MFCFILFTDIIWVQNMYFEFKSNRFLQKIQVSIKTQEIIINDTGTIRPPVGRSWYCLAAINTEEDQLFKLFKGPTKPTVHLLHSTFCYFVRNVSHCVNDDIVFLYCKSLRAKNNCETSDGIRYLERRRNWWV